jgi:AraC-like DNA-binding protein
MIVFQYKLTSYTSFLEQLASLLGTKLTDHHLILPEQYGSGFMRIAPLADGLEALVYHFKLKQELVLKREKTSTEFYTLIFDEIDQPSGASISINADQPESNAIRNAAIYLNSFLFDIESVLHKNVDIKGVRILLPVEWMQESLQIREKKHILEKYLNLKTAGIWYMPVDLELKELLYKVISTDPSPPLFYQNKLLRIIERFFSWLYEEMQSLSTTSGVNRQDIEAAQKIEGIITQDITVLPPTIKELAKEVTMSESKLKKIFKAVYGLPPYEYFQKHRMKKAQLMLLSGNSSIKDVGYTLGYSNLSNFTLAFKKEFNMLPSDLVRQLK